MRAIMESLFYVIYLIFIVGVGIYMTINKNKKDNKLFGLACVILGFGDAFHLIPRSVGLFTKTLDNPGEVLASWLGIGKLVTSITMTIFYVLLYLFIFKKVDKKRNLLLDVCVGVLTITRFVLCALPQNGWLHNDSNLTMGIVRNIPFTLLGILVIVLAFINFKELKPYRGLWILIILSFAFYLPVVLLAGTYSFVGMLMLPKTICYMIIGYLGFKDTRK